MEEACVLVLLSVVICVRVMFVFVRVLFVFCSCFVDDDYICIRFMVSLLAASHASIPPLLPNMYVVCMATCMSLYMLIYDTNAVAYLYGRASVKSAFSDLCSLRLVMEPGILTLTNGVTSP